MTTRLELRTALRRRLEDTGAAPLWDDASLNDALAGAMRADGARFPSEKVASVTVAAGATSVAVGGLVDPERIARVRDERGETVARDEGAGGLGSGAGLAQGWRWWNATLLLARPAATAGTWTIEHLAGRELPADDATSADILPGDEEIVLLLATVAALSRRAVEDTKRGTRTSLPPLVEAVRLAAERLIAARKRRAMGGRLG